MILEQIFMLFNDYNIVLTSNHCKLQTKFLKYIPIHKIK